LSFAPPIEGTAENNPQIDSLMTAGAEIVLALILALGSWKGNLFSKNDLKMEATRISH